MNNLITAAFNIKPENIESIHSIKEDGSLNIHITLSIKPMECPICGAKAISHGKHKKTIKHPAILDFDGNIIWYARRYKCTQCSHTFFNTILLPLPAFLLASPLKELSCLISKTPILLTRISHSVITFLALLFRNYLTAGSIFLD